MPALAEAPRHPLNRVALIEPPSGIYLGFEQLVRTEPLGLMQVAGAIKDRVKEVRIYDDRVKPGQWRQELGKNPSMIGIRCNYTADVPTVNKLINDIAEAFGEDLPPIIIGGHHISLRPQDVFRPEVKAVAIGHGEKIMQDAVDHWAKYGSFRGVEGVWYQDDDGAFISNVKENAKSSLCEFRSAFMDQRAEPARDLVEEYRDGYYFLYYPRPVSIETARGCRFACTFCSVHEFNNKQYRVESPQRTAERIANLPADALYVNIMDDLAFYDIDGAIELAEAIIRMGVNNRRFWNQMRVDTIFPENPEKRYKSEKLIATWAEAGLDMTLEGLESLGAQGELKKVHKGTKVWQNAAAIRLMQKYGIKNWGAQIVFQDWDIPEFDAAIRANQELEIEAPQFTILTPLPGTEDFKKAKENRLLLTEDPGRYNFFDSVLATKLSEEEFHVQHARLYRETGAFGKDDRGRFVNRRLAVKMARSLEEDIKADRITRARLDGTREAWERWSDPETHLVYLRQVRAREGISQSGVVFNPSEK